MAHTGKHDPDDDADGVYTGPEDDGEDEFSPEEDADEPGDLDIKEGEGI